MLSFDSYNYVKKLKKIGISERQAEIQAETFREIINYDIISKNDLKKAKEELQFNLKETKSVLKNDLASNTMIKKIAFFVLFVR